MYSINTLAFAVLCLTASYANAIECSGESSGKSITAQVDLSSLQGTLAVGAETSQLNCRLIEGLYRCFATTEHSFYKVTISAGRESGYIEAEGRYTIAQQIYPTTLVCKNP